MTRGPLAVLEAAVPNFRDAGGLPTGTGSVRRGVVYRSAQMGRLTQSAQAALVGLGVGTVVDLRTAEESAHRPDNVPPTVEVVTIDVLADRPHSDVAEVADLVNQSERQASVAAINAAIGEGLAEQHMLETYRHFVTLSSAITGYGTLFTTLARRTTATVIHCTAGKDRTGWAVAILQLLAGATREDVMADYLESNEPMLATYGPMLEGFAALGGDADALSHMMLVHPEYLDSALTRIDAVHGGVHGYLVRGLGMDPEDVDRLRDRLQDPLN